MILKSSFPDQWLFYIFKKKRKRTRFTSNLHVMFREKTSALFAHVAPSTYFLLDDIILQMSESILSNKLLSSLNSRK